jgi:hypothetical protein
MLENVPDMCPNPSKSPLRTNLVRLCHSETGWRGMLRRFAGHALLAAILPTWLCVSMLSGCSYLRPKPPAEYVYVTARQTFLRDRVAAVSNRTATVENGQRLQVLEHGRRFYRVQTEKGEQGWIDEKAVATEEVFDAFKALAEAHQNDPAVASGVVQDEVNLHLKPGRTTEVFYRLAEGDKLQLLQRATLPKPLTPGAAPESAAGTTTEGAPPVAMEDWWLARDVRGRAGWLLSHYVDVDVPDAVAQYAEGQRLVAAYVLTTVHDDGAKQDIKDIPIYLTVLAPPHEAGLPYDFDQVRVFTWNMKMHRYETAYRDKNIEGYLPVTIKMGIDPYGKFSTAQTPLPAFTYKILPADAPPVVPDPVTGMVTPERTIEKTYRLEGNIVRRIAPPGSKDEPEAHPVAEVKKPSKGKTGKKK